MPNTWNTPIGLFLETGLSFGTPTGCENAAYQYSSNHCATTLQKFGAGTSGLLCSRRQMFEHHAQFTRAFGFIFFLLANKRRICRPTGFDYILLLA